MKTIVNDTSIRTISLIQRFTYRCLEMFGPNAQDRPKEIKKELMDVWAASLFEGMDYNVKFDEELWMPVEPEMYGNVAQLYVRDARGTELRMVHIDFRDAWHEIFNVEYVREIEEQV